MTGIWIGTITLYHIILIVIITYILYMKWLRSKYPPGPWPLPIIGNLHLLSPKLHQDLTKLAKQYGPVYTIWIGPRANVIVCDLQSAREVCVTKGFEFGGRAMDSKSMSVIWRGHEDLVSRSIDDKVTVMRKIALSVIKSKGSGGLPVTKIVEDEVKQLIKELRRHEGQSFYPRDLTNIRVTNTIMELIFNYRFEGADDPEFLKYVKSGVMEVESLRKCFIADVYNFLWYCLPSVRKAAYDFADSWKRRFSVKHFAKHEESYQEGTIRDLADVVIKTKRELALSDASSVQLSTLNCEMLLMEVFAAATETTLDTIMWAIAAILRHSSLQERIYEELANVIEHGKDHSNHKISFDQPFNINPRIRPFIDISMKPKLPYLNAFIHEVLRMCPAVPLALPHKAMVDTSIGSFLIPKDTPVMLNIFAMHRDSKMWQDPLIFKPERFLTGDGHFDSEKAKNLMTFSKGPRNCIGENLARIELFLILANIFYNFVLSTPDIDIVPLLGDGDVGIVLETTPFDVKFTSR